MTPPSPGPLALSTALRQVVLSRTARQLLDLIRSRTADDPDVSRHAMVPVSLRTIASELGVTVRTGSSALEELVEARVLVVARGAGRDGATAARIADPELWRVRWRRQRVVALAEVALAAAKDAERARLWALASSFVDRGSPIVTPVPRDSPKSVTPVPRDSLRGEQGESEKAQENRARWGARDGANRAGLGSHLPGPHDYASRSSSNSSSLEEEERSSATANVDSRRLAWAVKRCCGSFPSGTVWERLRGVAAQARESGRLDELERELAGRPFRTAPGAVDYLEAALAAGPAPEPTRAAPPTVDVDVDETGEPADPASSRAALGELRKLLP